MLASLLCNTPRATPGRWYTLPDGKRTTDKELALDAVQGLREDIGDSNDVSIPVEASGPREIRFPARAENMPDIRAFDDEDDALIALLVALSTKR